jgi:hypothetical protein
MSQKENKINNKKRLLEALSKCFNNVTIACRDTNLDRSTYYTYYDEDPEFKEAVDALDNITHDFVENALLKKCKEGSDSSIQFYLKTKGKKRGYVDKTEVDLNIRTVEIIVPPKPNSNGESKD